MTIAAQFFDYFCTCGRMLARWPLLFVRAHAGRQSTDRAMTQSTEELIRQVLGGRRSAFAELVRRHERSVMGVCGAILRDEDAALDASQEAFVDAFEKLDRLRSAARFGAWVLTIARRAAYRELRRRRREGTVDALQLADVPLNSEPLHDVFDVLDQVARLPAPERRAVLLYYFDNQSVDQVSRATGRSVGTVTKQLTRARRRLRQWFEQETVS
jgi:RNA polymerase sigma factor (sigma-70 family)